MEVNVKTGLETEKKNSENINEEFQKQKNSKDKTFLEKLWNNEKNFFDDINYSKKYSWRTQFIESINKDADLQNGDFYQVGVYSGASIKLVLKKMKDIGVNFRYIYGFDSFEGLPIEDKDEFNPESWYKGRFDMKYFGNIEKIKEKLINFIKNDNIILIDGFFEKTMNADSVNKYNMNKASYIDMDCDTYSSTVEALEFFIKNNILVKGTIIGYDDWCMGFNYDDIKIRNKYEYKCGQSKAHKEFCDKYNITCKRLKNYKLSNKRAVYIVDRIDLI